MTQEENIILISLEETCLKKKHLAFSQEIKLEDSQVRSREIERLIDTYPENRYHGVK